MMRTALVDRAGIAALAAAVVLGAGCSDSGSAHSTSPAKHGDAGASAQSADPCPHGTLDGSYEITSAHEATAIAECEQITGSLTVSGDGIDSLNLPKLKSVGGALDVKNMSALTTLELPSLTKVAKDLTIDANPVLSTASLPALENVQILLVTNDVELTQLDVPALSHVAYLGVQSLDALTTVEFQSIESVGVFVINMNATLGTIRFPALRIITSDGFIILRNPELSKLDLPLLRTLMGDIAVQDNPKLPSCQIDALVAQLDSQIPVGAHGNDDSATCP